jgi:tripartite-type tricarboxylate transporter receptor subunit TctC
MAFGADNAWPKGKLTLVWHSSAGSAGDIMMRALAKFIGSKTKVAATVENRSGASGANAWSTVARSKPDGSTLLGVSSTFIASPLQNNIPYNYTTFDPIARLFTDAVCIYVGADSKYNTFEEFLDDAKSRPGELTLTGATSGSVEFVAWRQFAKEAGIDVPVVPFESGSEGVIAVIGGHVTAGISDYGEMSAAEEGGKVRVIATFNKIPNKDVPTIADLGYKAHIDKFRGIVVAKDTPQEIKNAIFDLLKEAMEDPDFKEYYTTHHMVPAFTSGEEFYKIMEAQHNDVKAALEESK